LPFDLVGFAEATPGTGTPNIAVALGEDFFTIVAGDWILVKEKYLLLAEYLSTSTPAQLQVDMPELKPWYSFIKAGLLADLDPTEALTYQAARPLPLWDILGGKGFKPDAQLRCMSRNATDEVTLAGLWMGSGKITRAMEDAVEPTHTLRGTSATVQVAYTWTVKVMTWDNQLPEGKYCVVGMRAGVYKASGPALGLARLRFQVAPASGYRPGVPSAIMEGACIEYMSVHEWPTFPWKWPVSNEYNCFRHTQLPGVETLSPAADTSTVIELELQKVA